MDKFKKIITKNLQKALLNEARVLPSDAGISACPSIYKGVSCADTYVKCGFVHQLAGAGGTARGEGIYARLELKGAMNNIGWYGPDIVQGKVLNGFKNYIMYDANMYPSIAAQIKRYYGRLLTPEEQIDSIVKDSEDARILKREGRNMNFGNAARICRKWGIRGLMYDWDACATVLPFDFSSVVVWAIMKNASYHRSDPNPSKFLVKTFDDESRELQQHMFDWDYQLYKVYDWYDREKITKVELNDEMYALVKSYNKGYNFVKLDTIYTSEMPKPEEISDIWLRDMPSLPSIDTGIFTFTYNSLQFFGAVCCPTLGGKSGIWFPDGLNEYNSPNIQEDGWYDLSMANLVEIEEVLRTNLVQTRLVENNRLRNIFRKHLNEAIEDKNEAEFVTKHKCYIYRATKPSLFPSIFQNGQLRQFAGENDGCWYGDGIYAVLSNDKVQYWKYDKETHSGGVKMIVLGGFNGFLIFDEHWAKVVYKDSYDIKSQVYLLFPKEVADDIWTDFSNLINPTPSFRQQWLQNELTRHTAAGTFRHGFPTDCKNTLSSNGNRTTGILHGIFDNSVLNKKYSNLFSKYHIKGAIYNGGNDGLAIVCWNFDEVIPFEYTKDKGATWHRDLFNFQEAKERSFNNTDPVSKFRYLYDYVSDNLVQCDINGTSFNITTVKKGQKWNIININSRDGRKLSPIDFDVEPKVGINGTFDFSYNGINMHGIVYAPSLKCAAVWFPDNISQYDFPDSRSEDEWYDLSIDNLNEIAETLKGV